MRNREIIAYETLWSSLKNYVFHANVHLSSLTKNLSSKINKSFTSAGRGDKMNYQENNMQHF